MRRVAALLVERGGVGGDGRGRPPGGLRLGQPLGAHDRARQLRSEDDVLRAIASRQVDDRLHRLASAPGDADVGRLRKLPRRRFVFPIAIDDRRRVGQEPAGERLAGRIGIFRFGKAGQQVRQHARRAPRDLHQVGVLREHRLHDARSCPARARCPRPNARPVPAAGRGRQCASFSSRRTKRSSASGRPRSERRRSVSRLARRSHSGRKPSRPARMKVGHRVVGPGPVSRGGVAQADEIVHGHRPQPRLCLAQSRHQRPDGIEHRRCFMPFRRADARTVAIKQ